MFCSTLCKLMSARTPVTSKSINCIHGPLKLLLQSKLTNEFYYSSFKPPSKRSLPHFLSSSLRRHLSKETKESVETPRNSQVSDKFENSLFSNIDYDAVTNNDPELTKKLKLIMTETYLLYEEGKEVPSELKIDQLKELLNLKSKSSRMNFLKYLYQTEKRKEADVAKKLRKREEYEKYLKEKARNAEETVPSEDKLVYGIADNSLFLRIYNTSMDKYNNFSLHLAAMLGPKVIIDCDYSSNMVARENKLCAKQLMMGFGDNRKHQFPSYLVFCNYDKEDPTSKHLEKYMPTMYDRHFPIDFQSESYLNLYPKGSLVYLTPHCKEELHTINTNDIYIIGAIVDSVNPQQLSLGKAKKEGLRMAKFPLDQYVEWGSGTKNLTINQCIMIMTDMYWKNDWKFAFNRWLPKRKLLSKDHAHYANKMLKRLRRDNDAMSIDSKFNQRNTYNQRYDRGNNYNFSRKHIEFKTKNPFNEPESEYSETLSSRNKLPPRRSR